MKSNRITFGLTFILIVFVANLFPLNAKADNHSSRNSIYVETVPLSFCINVNYERLLFKENRTDFNVGLRLGLGLYGFGYGIPVTVSILKGKNHHAELGIGLTFWGCFEKAKGRGTDLNGFVGYRYQPGNGGKFFKIGFAPIFTFDDFDRSILPVVGVSIGGTF